MDDGFIEIVGFWASTFVSFRDGWVGVCVCVCCWGGGLKDFCSFSPFFPFTLLSPSLPSSHLSFQQPKLVMGLVHGERIAQCQHVKLITKRSFPIQVDGGKLWSMPNLLSLCCGNATVVMRTHFCKPDHVL